MNESKFYRFIRPLIPKPLRPLCLKYQELLSYLVFGVLTTVVNFAVYFPLNRVISYLVANVIAWIIAVAFAFVVNKAFVFEDSRWDAKSLLFQAGSFAAARLLSLGLEEAMLLVMVEWMGISENLTKIVAQVLVIILNYIASKFIIFAKKKK